MAWTLGFVGCGVMAEVMIAGILEEGLLDPQHIIASNRRATRSEALASTYGIRTTDDNLEVARTADVLVLSVKPQSLAGVLNQAQGPALGRHHGAEHRGGRQHADPERWAPPPPSRALHAQPALSRFEKG